MNKEQIKAFKLIAIAEAIALEFDYCPDDFDDLSVDDRIYIENKVKPLWATMDEVKEALENHQGSRYDEVGSRYKELASEIFSNNKPGE